MEQVPLIDCVLTFEARQRGTGGLNQQTLEEDRISEVGNDVPAYIRDIQEVLRARRISDRQRVGLPFMVSAFFLSEPPSSLFSLS